MSLEATFDALVAACDRLDQAGDNLLWAVVQAQPQARWEHPLVQHYEACTNDVVGRIKGARALAGGARAAAGDTFDLLGVRRNLWHCQEDYQRILTEFYGDSFAFERRTDLRTLGAQGSEWTNWVHGVEDALVRCPAPLHAVGEALAHCWQDLVDRVSVLQVSAQANYSGLQINVGAPPLGRKRAAT